MTERQEPDRVHSDSSPSDDSDNRLDAHIPLECEDRDNSHSEIWENEPSTEPELGHAGNEIGSQDERLDVDLAIEKHDRRMSIRLKPRTLRLYSIIVRRFARSSDLKDLTKNQLRGTKGKTILLHHIGTIPDKSKAVVLSALKSHWTVGMGLDWPIDPRTDLPRLPGVSRRHTPLDAHVRDLAQRYELEPDTFLNLIWQFTGQYGWRPSQSVRMPWRSIQRDETGRAISFSADGGELDFKTHAPIIARIFPSVERALTAWETLCPHRSEDDPILCWRDSKGRTEHRPLTERLLYDHWERQKHRWGIEKNPITPVDMRHWTNTACRKVGLSKAATAGLCGHEGASDSTYRDFYDNPMDEELIAEQSRLLPDGPLGLLALPNAQLLDQVPTDAIALVSRFLKNEIARSDMADELDKIRILYTRNPARKVFYIP